METNGFYIINVHLKSGVDHSVIRNSQINDVVSSLPAGKKIILCGDFNATPNEKIHEILENNGMKCVSKLDRTTYRKRNNGDIISLTLDYVYCSSITLIGSETSVTDIFLPTENYPSDHLYITSEFRT